MSSHQPYEKLMAVLTAGSLPECSFDDGKTWVTDDVAVAEAFSASAHVIRTLSATQQPVSEGVGWRPIETAPKDGTAVDLWIAWSADDQRRIPDAFWGRAEPAFGGGVGEGWVDPSGGFGGECGLISSEAEALFWMPLPPAPSPIGEEKGAES